VDKHGWSRREGQRSAESEDACRRHLRCRETRVRHLPMAALVL